LFAEPIKTAWACVVLTNSLNYDIFSSYYYLLAYFMHSAIRDTLCINLKHLKTKVKSWKAGKTKFRWKVMSCVYFIC